MPHMYCSYLLHLYLYIFAASFVFIHIWGTNSIVRICCTCIRTYLLQPHRKVALGSKTFGSLFRRALIPQHLPNCDLYLFCLIWNHKLQTKQIWCTPPICNFQFQKSLLDKSYLQGAECKILWIWPAKCEECDTLKKNDAELSRPQNHKLRIKTPRSY